MPTVVAYAWLMFRLLCLSILLALAVVSTEKFGGELLRDRRLYLKSLAASVVTFLFGCGLYQVARTMPGTSSLLLFLFNSASIALVFQVHLVRAAKFCFAQVAWGGLMYLGCGLLYALPYGIARLFP